MNIDGEKIMMVTPKLSLHLTSWCHQLQWQLLLPPVSVMGLHSSGSLSSDSSLMNLEKIRHKLHFYMLMTLQQSSKQSHPVNGFLFKCTMNWELKRKEFPRWMNIWLICNQFCSVLCVYVFYELSVKRLNSVHCCSGSYTVWLVVVFHSHQCYTTVL